MAHILLVDDNDGTVASLSLALRSKGHTVVTAGDGDEGIQKYAAEKFDVVVTDILMPEMDGLGFIAELKRTDSEAKIIAISGGGVAVTYDFLDAARKYGATATLCKPFAISELHSLVEKCSPK